MGIVGGIMVPHPPMIVPAVGRGGESIIEETTQAYGQAAKFIAGLKPDTIIISSPHSIMYSDYFHISPGKHAYGDFRQFGAPQVRFEVDYDVEFVKKLSEYAAEDGIDAGVLGEKDASLDHGTMVPLYFIMPRYPDAKYVRIGLSGFSLAEHYCLGMLIKRISEETGKRVAYIASGDLSHKLKEDGPYGFDEAGPRYDEKIMDVMGSGEFDRLLDFEESFLNQAAECGHRSFVMMAGAFDRMDVEIQRLSHQDVTGVGYGICTYTVKTGSDTEQRAFLDLWRKRAQEMRQKQKDAEDIYVRLARRSLEHYILTGTKIHWEEIRQEFLASEEESVKEHLSRKRAGTFVSLHEHGQLRGCIGTIVAKQDCIAEEIIENAISASTRDPRFSPVKAKELEELDYSVDVLGEIEPIASENELDVKRYGVIVTKGMKRGLLLPNLDGVVTIEQQISIAKQKAGLALDEEGCKLKRFEVVRHF